MKQREKEMTKYPQHLIGRFEELRIINTKDRWEAMQDSSQFSGNYVNGVQEFGKEIKQVKKRRFKKSNPKQKSLETKKSQGLK